MTMIINDGIRRAMESDLGLNVRFEKGKTISVKNCWHFSTDGNLVDFLFRDDEDFVSAMNRLFLLSVKYNIVILAFVLMDTHIHIILWGDFDECNRFVHEFLKLTSMYLSGKYSERHKLENVAPSYQVIDNDRYLKTAICYVIKNPTEGGIAFNAMEYPWSSSSLYFKRNGYWNSVNWDSSLTDSSEIGCNELRRTLKTRNLPKKSFKMIGNMVFPNEYVAVETVEKIFRTHKGLNYYLCISKESDVESVQGSISRLSIPYAELHQHKQDVCRERFGVDSIRKLNTTQRIILAKILRASYNCSPKQIAKSCGLIFNEVKSML